MLGDLFADGRGVAQDYAEAAIWYRMAADQGNGYWQMSSIQMLTQLKPVTK